MPKAEAVKLIFSLERETKSKMRFQEMAPVEKGQAASPVAKDKAVVEKLYVSKKTLKAMGNPDTLHVTIEAP